MAVWHVTAILSKFCRIKKIKHTLLCVLHQLLAYIMQNRNIKHTFGTVVANWT